MELTFFQVHVEDLLQPLPVTELDHLEPWAARTITALARARVLQRRAELHLQISGGEFEERYEDSWGLTQVRASRAWELVLKAQARNFQALKRYLRLQIRLCRGDAGIRRQHPEFLDKLREQVAKSPFEGENLDMAGYEAALDDLAKSLTQKSCSETRFHDEVHAGGAVMARQRRK